MAKNSNQGLINCPDCGHEASKTALTCPNCGKQLRKPKRSIFGKICIWSFYIFNILMLIWLVAGISSVADRASTDGAYAVGASIGAAMIIGVWAVGDIILGIFALLTRPKR